MKAVLAVLLLVSAVHAQTVPPLTGRVVDTADLLSSAAEDVLSARLEAFEDSTSNQVAVLTIPSLGGANLEEYGTRVFRAWGLGQAERDNGVLLLVARDDRELRIEVGYGLEGSLTDARASEIIRDVIVPRFRGGDYESGILAGADAVIASVEGTFQPAESPVRKQPFDPCGLVFCLVPGIMMFRFLKRGADVGSEEETGIVGASAFMGVFVAVAMLMASNSVTVALASLPLVPLLVFVLNRALEWLPAVGPARREARRHAPIIRAAQARGERSVVIDGVSYSVPSPGSSSSGSSSGGSSSGSSFGGGGGSSGGGGASGSW